MATRTVFYVKYSRRNGQVSIIMNEGTNVPMKFYDVEEAKRVAGEAISRLIRKKNKSPAAVDRVWVFQTKEWVAA